MRTENPDPSPGAVWGRNLQPAPAGPTELGSRPLVFWLLVLGAVATMQVPLPFRLAGLLLSLPAIWVGVTVLVRLGRNRRQGRPARRAWPFGIGLGIAVTMLLGQLADAALYPIVADREQCVAEANTRVAMSQCTDQVEDRLQRLRDRLAGAGAR